MVHDGTPFSVVQRILYDYATKTHINIGNEEYVYRKCIELLDLCYNLCGNDSRTYFRWQSLFAALLPVGNGQCVLDTKYVTRYRHWVELRTREGVAPYLLNATYATALLYS